MSDGSAWGVRWASLILLAWLLSLVGLIGLDLHHLDGALAQLPWGVARGRLATTGLETLLVLTAVLVRSFLHTGLFIVAHDAMHGVLRPAPEPGNDRWGRLALALYAALPYGSCQAKHQLHHRDPGGPSDPDFHRSRQSGPVAPLAWFLQFLSGYLSWRQMGILLSGWAALALLCSAFTPTAGLNVLLFCVAPLLISSWQLFLFGTYLPHRASGTGMNHHHARSLNLPVWLSFLVCYHFGYHWEHHQFPSLAWYELPGSRCQAVGDRVPKQRI